MTPVPATLNMAFSPLRNSLPVDGSSTDHFNWQRELATAVRTVPDLLKQLNLSPEDFRTNVSNFTSELSTNSDTLRQFPVLVPENFLRRMIPGDANDPLLRQVLAQAAEDLPVPGFVDDAVGDLAARRGPGLLQKYAGRALLIASGACAVHCRYCFRRNYPYSNEPHRLDEWDAALNLLQEDTSTSEVILSGGDPLTLNDHRLEALCRRLDAIQHIERIRIHTRLPIVIPSRVTPEFERLLSSLRAQPIMVVHANHGSEIQGDCAYALRRLVRSGIPVLNQTVLLRGVNDSVDVLEDLSRRLIRLGVMPYYLHQLDRVAGAAHFEVPAQIGLQIIEELGKRLPGYAVPRFVQEIPGATGKTNVSAIEFHHEQMGLAPIEVPSSK
jgi:EF-P beta-lysylation protein EpmB